MPCRKVEVHGNQIAFALKQAETGTLVGDVIHRIGISEQTFYRWKKVYGGLGVVELRIHDLTATRMPYRYFRIYILLHRKGWLVNHKRVYRPYREDGLSLRLRLSRWNVSAMNRERQPAASAANEM